MTTRMILGLLAVLLIAGLAIVLRAQNAALDHSVVGPGEKATVAKAPSHAPTTARTGSPLSRFREHFRDSSALTMEITIETLEAQVQKPVLTARMEMKGSAFNSHVFLPGESKPAISFQGEGDMITEKLGEKIIGPYRYENSPTRLQGDLPQEVLCALSLIRSTWLGADALWPGLIAVKLEQGKETMEGDISIVRYERPHVTEVLTIDRLGRLTRWEQINNDLTKVSSFRYIETLD